MRRRFTEEFTATDEKIGEIFWCRKFGIGGKKNNRSGSSLCIRSRKPFSRVAGKKRLSQ